MGAIYIAQNFKSLQDGKMFTNAECLRLYDQDQNATDNDLFFWSPVKLPEDRPLNMCFFCADWGTRESVIAEARGKLQFELPTSWIVIWDSYMRILSGWNTEIQNRFDDVYLTVNLSFGDFCLLIFNDDENLRDQAYQFAVSMLHECDMSLMDVWQADAELIERRNKIIRRARAQYVYNYTDLNELLNHLFATDIDTVDKADVLLHHASVLLFAFLEETNRIWLKPNGENRYFQLDFEQDVRTISSTFVKNYKAFLRQARSDNLYTDRVWSLVFLSNALLAATAGMTLENNKYKRNADYSDAHYNDFHGFIPIVSDGLNTMKSFYCDQFGLLYSVGFLLIPYSNTFDLFGVLPSLVHEFSHYISNTEREKRNDLIIKLIFNSVLTPLFMYLRNMRSNLYNDFTTDYICEEFRQKYRVLVERCVPDIKDSGELANSMFFLNLTLNMLEIIDFDWMCDIILRSENNEQSIGQVPDAVIDECVEKWRRERKSAVLTFTMALREIRSDMAMCVFLNIDLESYIQIMANEYEWASYSWKHTADSVILRFGFMTRYLFYSNIKGKSESERLSRHEFNLMWKDKVYQIIDEIKNRLSNKEKQEKLENMQGYLDQYIKINLECEMENESKGVVSIFEKDLFYMPFEESYEEESLLGIWQRQFLDQKADSTLLANLGELYKYYKERNFGERIVLNYQARVIMRDLYMFFPQIDE